MERRLRLRVAGVAVGVLALSGCGGSDSSSPAAPAPPASGTVATAPLPAAVDEAGLLDGAYPVDVEQVEAVFDILPHQQQVRVWSATTFRMRPGQSMPVVHFLPAVASASVAMALNGEPLDPRREEDVRLFRYETSGQDSVELQRALAPGVSHRLEASHVMPLTDALGRFFTDVNDFEGHGNEVLFPTLNSPRDLARHVLTFRVHSSDPYRIVGSGLVTPGAATDAQEWVLDTEREVASYTVMFFLAPDRDVVVDERRVEGVDVRVMAFRGGIGAEQAYEQIGPWLAELQSTLGPFPMPRGLSIVLTQGGGGMEYYGATITSLRALRHEIFHMYYGCSTVATTYRDSWWDEAINMWYELSVDPAFPPIDPGYRSGIVGSRTPVTVGFDQRAYDEGARIIQAVAADMGGREPAVAFFSHLHRTRLFAPFTTVDLADDILAYSGADFHERFDGWLYDAKAAAGERRAPTWLHQVDLTPPPRVADDR
jgi:hypothetical protein